MNSCLDEAFYSALIESGDIKKFVQVHDDELWHLDGTQPKYPKEFVKRKNLTIDSDMVYWLGEYTCSGTCSIGHPKKCLAMSDACAKYDLMPYYPSIKDMIENHKFSLTIKQINNLVSRKVLKQLGWTSVQEMLPEYYKSVQLLDHTGDYWLSTGSKGEGLYWNSGTDIMFELKDEDKWRYKS